MLSFIGMIIAGAVLGALARLIMPGVQNISILWTVVLGAVGALIGASIASFFGVAHTDGFDWIKWALSLIAAIIAIAFAAERFFFDRVKGAMMRNAIAGKSGMR